MKEESVKNTNNAISSSASDSSNTNFLMILSAHKAIIIMMTFVFSFLILICSFYIAFIYDESSITSVHILNYDDTIESYDLKITFSALTTSNVSCYVSSNDVYVDDNFTKVVNGSCIVKAFLDDEYLFIKDKQNNVKTYLIDDLTSRIFVLEILDDNIYLPVNGEVKIRYNIKNIGEDIKFDYNISKAGIIEIEDNTVKALAPGEVSIKASYQDYVRIINVVVTDLINTPSINDDKKLLSCNYYDHNEAQIIDKALTYDVETAGYQTRAGVVAAARFLTLKFPYRIEYFLENGRLTESTVGYADGEGRYYHKGLYLDSSKFNDITISRTGPVVWGCPLRNLNYKDYRSNGLDCSGFVAWVLYNGGFDIGDLGAPSSSEYEEDAITSVGEIVKISSNKYSFDKIKAGDLVFTSGHVAIVIGKDDNNIYIAEEIRYHVGSDVLSFTKDEFAKQYSFNYVVLMDKYYKSDGNYTQMW